MQTLLADAQGCWSTLTMRTPPFANDLLRQTHRVCLVACSLELANRKKTGWLLVNNPPRTPPSGPLVVRLCVPQQPPPFLRTFLFWLVLLLVVCSFSSSSSFSSLSIFHSLSSSFFAPFSSSLVVPDLQKAVPDLPSGGS